MTVFGQIKSFIGGIVRNPLTALAVAYIVYQVVKKYAPAKEAYCDDDLEQESVKVKHLADGTDILTDTSSGRQVAVKGLAIKPLDHKERFTKLREKLGTEEPAVAAEFPMDEFHKGIAVETEHTDDPIQAARIALDHLSEDPAYYTKLKQVEG